MAIVPIKLGERPKTFARVIDFTGIDGSEYKLPIILKYRTRSEYIAWIEARANLLIKASEEKPKAKASAKAGEVHTLTQDHAKGEARQIDEMLEILEGWGLEGHEFNRDNMTRLADEFPQVVPKILGDYRDACMFGRSGN